MKTNKFKIEAMILFFAFSLSYLSRIAAQEDFYPWSVSEKSPVILDETPKTGDFDDMSLSPAVSLTWMIKFYNATSSSEQACTFKPTCSQYTREAILKHGVVLGLIMGAERVLRYHHDHTKYELFPSNLGYRLYDPLKYNDFWF